jgi:hypothetical protein
MKKLVYLLACLVITALVLLNVFCKPFVEDDGTCSDGIKNGKETGVDCGGADCGKCASGQACNVASDCASDICQEGTCVDATCTDGMKDGAETDVDCGGPFCSTCATGKACNEADDCASGVCTDHICQAPSCGDGVTNGEETDVDCGGPLCDSCTSGKHCLVNDDCSSGLCDEGICTETVLLTIQIQGTGRITSLPAGIDATTTTSQAFPINSTITLQARTTNGSNYYFTGWSGAASGSFHDYTFTLDAPTTITAQFNLMNANLAFVTSTLHSATLGNVLAYDTICNNLATSAGINNEGGTAYRAWMSTQTTSAFSRIGTAKGFVRLDGSVVFANLATSVSTNAIYHPINIDEHGAVLSPFELVWTGTRADGTGPAVSDNCGNWTNASGSGILGNTQGGPGVWTSWAVASCSGSFRLYCFGTTSSLTASLPSAPVGAKRIWASRNIVQGNSVLAADCSPPAGVTGTAALLVATPFQPASNRLSPTTIYVTPAGAVVGTGAQIIAGNLRTGVWQDGSGAFGAGGESAYTGSPALDQIGTLASTCQGWSSTIGNDAIIGMKDVSSPEWWSWLTTEACTQSHRVYCVEE